MQGGGVIYVPGEFTISSPAPGTNPPAALNIPYSAHNFFDPVNPITILGDGPGVSKIKKAAGSDFDLLQIERSFVTVSWLTFDGGGSTSGTNRGIVIGHLTGPATGEDVRRVHVTDCIVKGTQSHAVEVTGSQSTPISILNTFTRCVFAGNNINSLVRVNRRNTTQEFHGCDFVSFKNKALDLDQCEGVSCYDCLFESPLDNDTAQPYVLGNLSHNCQLVNCSFEEPSTATAAKWFVDLVGCNAWTILGCFFLRRTGSAPRAVRVGSTSLSIAIINPSLRLDNTTAPDTQGHIEVVGSTSECLLIGGHFEAGIPPVAKVLDLKESSTKSMWIGNRRWRMPQVTSGENPSPTYPTLHLGDVLSRAGRGLEAWNAHADDPSWIPLTVNRYLNQAALNGVPSTSKNRGTLAWVDNEVKLKVWNGTAWKEVVFTP